MGGSDRPAARMGDGADYGSTTRMGVLTDAEALLTCYGVGESQSQGQPGSRLTSAGSITAAEVAAAALTARQSFEASMNGAASTAGGAASRSISDLVLEDSGLQHAVVELSFTSSVRFLQPGLLLQVMLPHTTAALFHR